VILPTGSCNSRLVVMVVVCNRGEGGVVHDFREMRHQFRGRTGARHRSVLANLYGAHEHFLFFILDCCCRAARSEPDLARELSAVALPVQTVEFGLRVEEVHRGGAAVLEQG